MKKVLFLVIVALVVAYFIHRSAGKLSGEAEAIIAEEIDEVIEFLDSEMSWFIEEQDVAKLRQDIEEVKKLIDVVTVDKKDGTFIASTELKITHEPIFIDIRFINIDNQWKIDGMKKAGGDWKMVAVRPSSIPGDPLIRKASIPGKMKETMNAMRTLGNAIEPLMREYDPSRLEESLEELQRAMESAKSDVNKSSSKDAWGNDFHFTLSPLGNTMGYTIGSAGSDGIFGGFDQRGTYTEYEGKDIIYSNGTFIYGPELR